jgi:hypothetical protein
MFLQNRVNQSGQNQIFQSVRSDKNHNRISIKPIALWFCRLRFFQYIIVGLGNIWQQAVKLNICSAHKIHLKISRVTDAQTIPLIFELILYYLDLISAIFIVIAKIEMITPFITIFFLMCYLFVNVSTTLSTLIGAPSWRPSFKYYHWSLSLLGKRRKI